MGAPVMVNPAWSRVEQHALLIRREALHSGALSTMQSRYQLVRQPPNPAQEHACH
jgi:hypothetical protein